MAAALSKEPPLPRPVFWPFLAVSRFCQMTSLTSPPVTSWGSASRQSAKQTVCCLWYGECGAMTRNGQCVIILLWRGCQGFGALAAIKLSDTPWFSSSCRQVKWGCGLDSGKGICAVYSRRLWSQATAEILDLALCLY